MKCGGEAVLALPVSVRLGTSELAFTELVQVLLAGDSVSRVVHAHVRTRITSCCRLLVVATVSSLQNVDLGIVDSGIHMVVQGAIFSAEMLRAVLFGQRYSGKTDMRLGEDLQGRCSLRAEFAVQNEHVLLTTIAADGRPWFPHALPKEELFHTGDCVDIDSAGDVAPVILVIETTVDDVVRRNLRVVLAIEEIIQLQEQRKSSKFF